MKSAYIVSTLFVFLLSSVVINGQKQPVSAKATAISNDGGDASAKAAARSDGEGGANATVTSTADKGSSSKGVAVAESSDGGNATAALDVKATDGADVSAKVVANATDGENDSVERSVAAGDGSKSDTTTTTKEEENEVEPEEEEKEVEPEEEEKEVEPEEEEKEVEPEEEEKDLEDEEEKEAEPEPEADAKTIVDRIAAATGTVALESVELSAAVGKGNSGILTSVLETAFADGEVVGTKVSKAIKVTLEKTISKRNVTVDNVSTSFFGVLTTNPVQATRFSKILSLIVTDKGCPFIRPYLASLKVRAVTSGKDDTVVTAIRQQKDVVNCAYSICENNEFCCKASLKGAHVCEVCPKGTMCGYVAYGSGIISILNSTVPHKDRSFCACPY